MTDVARPADTSSSLRERVARRTDRLLRAVWRLMASGRTLLATLCVLLVVVCVGALVPQAGDLSDVARGQQADWLTGLRARAPELADVLQESGLLRLYSGTLFRLLLGWCAALCLVNLLALVTQERTASPRQACTWVGSLRGSASAAWARVGDALGSVGLQRPQPAGVGDCQVAVVRRAGLRGWAAALAYAGVLVLLAASLVAWRWGWRSAAATLLLGEPQELAPGTGIIARLEEIRLIPQARGADYQVESVVSLKGQEVDGTIILGQTSRGRSAGLSYYQVEDGPSLRLQVRDARGEWLDITDPVAQARPAAAVRRALRGSQQEQQYLVPAADLVINVVHFSPRPGEAVGAPLGVVLQVQAARWSDGAPLLDELLDSDAVLTVAAGAETSRAELVVAFERYVVLRAEREPELPVALAGIVLLLAGLLAALVWPARRVWVVLCAEEAGCRMRVHVPAAAAGAAWVEALQDGLQRLEGGTQ